MISSNYFKRISTTRCAMHLLSAFDLFYNILAYNHLLSNAPLNSTIYFSTHSSFLQMLLIAEAYSLIIYFPINLDLFLLLQSVLLS